MQNTNTDHTAELAQQYRTAALKQVDAEIEMRRLSEAAERGDEPWQKVDDFRHYRYLEDTEQALAAAMQLLAALGYRVEGGSA